MTRNQEEKIRAHCPTTEAGMIGAAFQSEAAMAQAQTPTHNWRPTLRDRLKKQIEAVAQEQSRARKANELFDLLEKNPEVARILELVEELQY